MARAYSTSPRKLGSGFFGQLLLKGALGTIGGRCVWTSIDAGLETISLRGAAIGVSIGIIERVLEMMESHPTTNLRDWLSDQLVFLLGRGDALIGPDAFDRDEPAAPDLPPP